MNSFGYTSSELVPLQGTKTLLLLSFKMRTHLHFAKVASTKGILSLITAQMKGRPRLIFSALPLKDPSSLKVLVHPLASVIFEKKMVSFEISGNLEAKEKFNCLEINVCKMT